MKRWEREDPCGQRPRGPGRGTLPQRCHGRREERVGESWCAGSVGDFQTEHTTDKSPAEVLVIPASAATRPPPRGSAACLRSESRSPHDAWSRRKSGTSPSLHSSGFPGTSGWGLVTVCLPHSWLGPKDSPHSTSEYGCQFHSEDLTQPGRGAQSSFYPPALPPQLSRLPKRPGLEEPHLLSSSIPTVLKASTPTSCFLHASSPCVNWVFPRAEGAVGVAM